MTQFEASATILDYRIDQTYGQHHDSYSYRFEVTPVGVLKVTFTRDHDGARDILHYFTLKK